MPQNKGHMTHDERAELVLDAIASLENAGSLVSSVAASLDHDGFEHAANDFLELTDKITALRVRLERLPR